MLTGLGGKVMEYDGENRPLSVTYLGKKTCYVYGADGKRLKKVEGLSPATLCTALPPAANVTTYFGPVEVRNWLGAEQVLTYPQPSVKLTNGVATWLHFDHLGSVRAITDTTGAKVESAIYRPFGEQSEWLQPGNVSPETKGWIGERYDADAGLQYLNARYYDPALGLFLQPDWFGNPPISNGVHS
jgi:RHS repeat-associated protein